MPKIVKDEDVYDAAIKAVIERGYSGATTKQIAEAADISEVTLFRKYGNKAELVKRAIRAMAAEIDLESASRHTGDISVDLLRVVKTYQGSAAQHGGFYFAVLSEVPRHPELAEMIDTPLGMISNISRLLWRYQEEGVLVKEPPFRAVVSLLGPLIVTNMIHTAAPEKHVQRFLDGRRQ
jgi:AcrR family transcriptional regulator